MQSSGWLSLGVVCTDRVRVEHGQGVLTFSLAEPGQCRSMACGCLRWRPEAGASAHRWELHSVHCLLPLPGHRKNCLGEHFWEEEFRRVTREISLLTRVKYHGDSLGSAQILFSRDQAGIGPIIPLSVHEI